MIERRTPGRRPSSRHGGREARGNPGNTGYYRVSYSPELAERLVRSADQLSTADRLSFLSDMWAMFVADRTSLAEALAVLNAVKSDRSLAVTGRVLDTLEAIDFHLAGDTRRDAFREYAIGVARPHFDRIGWDAGSDEEESMGLLRSRLIASLGKWCDAAIVAEAQERFERFRADPESLAADLRFPVAHIVGREADERRYEALRELAANASGMEESRLFYSGLAVARNPDLSRRTLALSLDGSLPPGTATRMIRWVAREGEQGELAWKFAGEHFEKINGLLGSIGSNDYFPRLASCLTSPDAEKELRDFAARHLGEDEAAAVERACAEMALNADVRERIRKQIVATIEPPL